MQLDELKWLQKWYLSNCNGEWEHAYGVEIGTLDNPGWTVKINLVGTDLQAKAFVEIKTQRSRNDWFVCWVKDQRFEVFGGPQNLSEIIGIFRRWAE